MRTIVVIVVALIVAIIYLSYYYRYPKNEVSVLQTTIDLFTMNLLSEKQPIVIQDAVGDIGELGALWFKYNIIRFGVVDSVNADSVNADSGFSQNKYKWLIFHPYEKTEILLYPACKPFVNGEPAADETILAIQLSAHQVLIVPFHWRYVVGKWNGDSMGIHDYITYVLP